MVVPEVANCWMKPLLETMPPLSVISARISMMNRCLKGPEVLTIAIERSTEGSTHCNHSDEFVLHHALPDRQIIRFAPHRHRCCRRRHILNMAVDSFLVNSFVHAGRILVLGHGKSKKAVAAFCTGVYQTMKRAAVFRYGRAYRHANSMLLHIEVVLSVA